jgi:hypothetical protein
MANDLGYRLALISNNNHLFRDPVPDPVTDHAGAAPELADQTLSSTKRMIILLLKQRQAYEVFFLSRFSISFRGAGDRNRIIFDISWDDCLIVVFSSPLAILYHTRMHQQGGGCPVTTLIGRASIAGQ